MHCTSFKLDIECRAKAGSDGKLGRAQRASIARREYGKWCNPCVFNDYVLNFEARDTLAEWLRRRPAKPMGSPCVGSNPTSVGHRILIARDNAAAEYWQWGGYVTKQKIKRPPQTAANERPIHHTGPPPRYTNIF